MRVYFFRFFNKNINSSSTDNSKLSKLQQELLTTRINKFYGSLCILSRTF